MLTRLLPHGIKLNTTSKSSISGLTAVANTPAATLRNSCKSKSKVPNDNLQRTTHLSTTEWQESLNRRLLERVWAILHHNHSNLPETLWGEAIQFAVWPQKSYLMKSEGDEEDVQPHGTRVKIGVRAHKE